MKQLTILAAALAAMTLAAPAAAQTLECSGVAIRPFDSYRTQIGTQNGPDIALSQRLFNGNHNGVISMNNDKTSYLVIEPQGGFDAVLVSGTTEKEVCSTPGPKPKFYSTHTEGGRIVLDPSRPLSASIKACTYHGFRKCERTVSIAIPGFDPMSFTANRGYPPCTDDGRPLGTPETEIGPQPHTGTFNIRVYGKLCIRGNQFQNCFRCRPTDSRPIGIGITCSDVHRRGYTAISVNLFQFGFHGWRISTGIVQSVVFAFGSVQPVPPRWMTGPPSHP